MTLDAWIAERERIEKAANRGPWNASTNIFDKGWPICNCGTVDGVKWGVETEPMSGTLLFGNAKTDSDFIADARTSLPAALRWMKEAAKFLAICQTAHVMRGGKMDAGIDKLLSGIGDCAIAEYDKRIAEGKL